MQQRISHHYLGYKLYKREGRIQNHHILLGGHDNLGIQKCIRIQPHNLLVITPFFLNNNLNRNLNNNNGIGQIGHHRMYLLHNLGIGEGIIMEVINNLQYRCLQTQILSTLPICNNYCLDLFHHQFHKIHNNFAITTLLDLPYYPLNPFQILITYHLCHSIMLIFKTS